METYWTGPSFYEKRIYRTAISQRLRNTALWGSRPVALLPEGVGRARGKVGSGGGVAGEPDAVSQNFCEEYSTAHYIIFIYTKISSDLAENTYF